MEIRELVNKINEGLSEDIESVNEDIKELTITDLQNAVAGSHFGDPRSHLKIGHRDYVKIGDDTWEYQPDNPHAFGSIKDTNKIFDLAKKAGVVELDGIEYSVKNDVNETKDVDGNIVDYNFSVTVTMDAENEVVNDSLKSDIQKAIEAGLEKYDASIEVEDV